MNPLEDGKGDIYLQPLNYKEAGEEEEKVVETAPPQFGDLIENVAERIASAELREISKVVNKAQQNREKFNKWATDFFNKHSSYIRQVLLPIGRAWQKSTGRDFYLEPIVEQLTSEGIEAFTQEDLAKLVPIWKEKREKDIVTLIDGGMGNANTKAQRR